MSESIIEFAPDSAILPTGEKVYYRDVQLDADDVRGLAAANVILIPALGAGFAAVPIGIHFFLDHAGTNDFVQTNAEDHLAILYNGESELMELGTEAQVTALIEASADVALYVPIDGAFVPVANAALDLDNNGAAEYSGNAGDDNTLSIRTFFRIVPMQAFS